MERENKTKKKKKKKGKEKVPNEKKRQTKDGTRKKGGLNGDSESRQARDRAIRRSVAEVWISERRFSLR